MARNFAKTTEATIATLRSNKDRAESGTVCGNEISQRIGGLSRRGKGISVLQGRSPFANPCVINGAGHSSSAHAGASNRGARILPLVNLGMSIREGKTRSIVVIGRGPIHHLI